MCMQRAACRARPYYEPKPVVGVGLAPRIVPRYMPYAMSLSCYITTTTDPSPQRRRRCARARTRHPAARRTYPAAGSRPETHHRAPGRRAVDRTSSRSAARYSQFPGDHHALRHRRSARPGVQRRAAAARSLVRVRRCVCVRELWAGESAYTVSRGLMRLVNPGRRAAKCKAAGQARATP